MPYKISGNLGDAQEFGDMLHIGTYYTGSTDNGINDRCVNGGGSNGAATGNVIDHFNISSLGNAESFGELVVTKVFTKSFSNDD